jgi:glycosyltransferase involved in cell wall biosynthesis
VSRPVALDATLADEPTTGIALYAHELWRAFTHLQPPIAVERWGASHSGDVPRGRHHSRTGWTLLQVPQLLTERRPALYHAMSNFNLPLNRVPGVAMVLTVHDLVPLLLPDTVSTAFRLQFRVWLSRSLRVADAVICVSQTTRQSLLETFEVDPARVHVVHHGVDHVDRLAAPDATTLKWLDALGLPEPWALYAGSLDARKNVDLVLSAVERSYDAGKPVTLVIAGQRWFGSSPVEKRVLALRDKGLDVRVTGYLEASVFYALMRRASVFLFPSRYEGFGLPPIEAMHLGVPTIISTAGSLPEVCEDAALKVDPDDARGLSSALQRVLDSPAFRADLSAHGREVTRKYRWATCAAQTRAIYDACLTSELV